MVDNNHDNIRDHNHADTRDHNHDYMPCNDAALKLVVGTSQREPAVFQHPFRTLKLVA